jgi:hypothetical protein
MTLMPIHTYVRVQEELSLLEQYAPEARAPLLFNRLNFLRILVHAGPQASGAKVGVCACVHHHHHYPIHPSSV